MKTNKEFADETVKVVMSLVGLMRPSTKEEFKQVCKIATTLIEHSVEDHMTKHFEAGAATARAATEGPKS